MTKRGYLSLSGRIKVHFMNLSKKQGESRYKQNHGSGFIYYSQAAAIHATSCTWHMHLPRHPIPAACSARGLLGHHPATGMHLCRRGEVMQNKIGITRRTDANISSMNSLMTKSWDAFSTAVIMTLAQYRTYIRGLPQRLANPLITASACSLKTKWKTNTQKCKTVQKATGKRVWSPGWTLGGMPFTRGSQARSEQKQTHADNPCACAASASRFSDLLYTSWDRTKIDCCWCLLSMKLKFTYMESIPKRTTLLAVDYESTNLTRLHLNLIQERSLHFPTIEEWSSPAFEPEKVVNK